MIKKKIWDKREIKLGGDRYVVLECKGHSGLTVGSYVLKPGMIFLESHCSLAYLRHAVAGKRCKLVKKEKVKNNDSK